MLIGSYQVSEGEQLITIVSDRHVGEKHKVDDGRPKNWQAVTGFTLPPGILTSVGIFLLPQVFSAWSALKRATSVLFTVKIGRADSSLRNTENLKFF